MEITFAPHDILQIDDAVITFRNFEGRADRYNRAGDRNFAIRIFDEDVADMLIEKGWNVKKKPPRNEGDDPFMTLKVKVTFAGRRPPNIYLQSGDNLRVLDEESCAILDDVDILNVCLDVRPYDWTMDDGSTGRTAYLQSIKVTQRIDRFAAEEADRIGF